jgi:tRNA G10  N-methylase Trm11
MKYLFILGNNPELSIAEILNVINVKKILGQSREFLAVESDKFDCIKICKRLGGTIKIGIILGDHPEAGPVLGSASSVEGKFKYGFSFYGQTQSNIGMKIKKQLKEQDISSRFVTSREPALSAVIVKKEKCHDFLVVPGFFALTCAVQDFEAFGKRDFGRPASDSLSGMLPPKVARMMINISGINAEHTLLDPFCGSGTVLAEALDLGITNLIGTDLSEKAIKDSETNLAWLAGELRITNYELRIEVANVKELSKRIKLETINAIVTEPYLGKPIRGNEDDMTIKKIIRELEELYIYAFAEFKKVLTPGGRIVIIIPEWHVNKKVLKMNIFPRVEQMGFTRLDDGDLMYKRENQKVWRNITVWEK